MDQTEILNTGTEILDQAAHSNTTIGGFLQQGEVVEGWAITSQINVRSGEAEVYRAQKDGEEGIVKYYRQNTNPKLDIMQRIQSLNHPDIINLYSFGLYKGRLFEIMEYANGGGLDSKNEDGTYKYLPLSEEEVIAVCKEMISAFKACHDIGIIHRDIKPGNVYYKECDEEADENGKYHGRDIVIADFGISSVMDDGEKYRKTRTSARTSEYAAPEINFKEINYKYDYYSLGVTLWELATGKEPYRTDDGRRLDSTYIMQLATEGFAADNLLSIKPELPKKLARLIRGLLVVDPDKRWGFDEVTDHLAGKEVAIAEVEKTFKLTVGGVNCTNLAELADALMDNPEAARKMIFQGQLKASLNSKFPEKARMIEEISDEASAKQDFDNGICKIAWNLSLNAPFKPGNGYSARGFDDIIALITNAPETMLPLMRDANSRFYIYLDVLDKKAEGEEIKAIANAAGDAELACKALVILNNRTIKPYKLARYQSFILDTPENLISQEISEDLQNRILSIIAEKSYDGLIYPWIDLHMKERGIKEYSPKTWQELMQMFGRK